MIGLAEWLATTYRPRGVRVSALCQLGVRTAMLEPGIAARHPTALAIAADEFLILPHESVRHDFARKAAAPDAWIARSANWEG